MDLGKLSKKEKIELIRKITSGEINVVNGQIIDSGVIVIKRENELFLNDKPVTLERLNEVTEAIYILPDNGRAD